jgi:hypothetical protein
MVIGPYMRISKKGTLMVIDRNGMDVKSGNGKGKVVPVLN